jgi:hypothetical protein
MACLLQVGGAQIGGGRSDVRAGEPYVDDRSLNLRQLLAQIK